MADEGMRSAPRLSRMQPTQQLSKEMHARAHAAIELVKTGAVDGALALSWVIWPPENVRRLQERKAA